MHRLYIVAPNRDIFNWWWRDKIHDETWTTAHNIENVNQLCYVSSVDSIRGIRNPHGLFIGEWYKRKDAYDILQQLMIASSPPNKTLISVYEQFKALYG